MTTMLRKGLSVFLAVFMVISLLGLSASAEDDTAAAPAQEEFAEVEISESEVPEAEEPLSETPAEAEESAAPEAEILFAAAAAETSGSFIFVAEKAVPSPSLIVAPMLIYYEAGDTIYDALTNSGIVLEGAGFVSVINGVAGNYTIGSDTGARLRTDPVAGITMLRISEDDPSYMPYTALGALYLYMTASEGAQGYPRAKTAYDILLTAFPAPQEAGTAYYADELNTALNEYEGSETGAHYAVTFSATNDANPQSSAVTVKSLKYLTEYTSDGMSFSLTPGRYSFSYAAGQNRVEGEFEVVSTAVAVSVTLPTADWLAAFDLYSGSPLAEGSYVFPNDGAPLRERTILVPDAAGTENGGNAYVYIRRSTETGIPPQSQLRARYAQYTDKTGAVNSAMKLLTWESNSEYAAGLYSADLAPQSLTLEVYRTGADGYVQLQTYTANIEKAPTLSSLKAVYNGYPLVADKPFAYAEKAYSYNISDAVTAVRISAATLGGDDGGYTITADGQTLPQGGNVTIPLPANADVIVKTVTVTANNGQSAVYTLTFNRVETVTVSFTPGTGTTVAVYDTDGNIVAPRSANTYELIRGNTFTYIATKAEYFHARQTFAATENRSFTVNVATVNLLDNMRLKAGTTQTGMTADYPLAPSFAGNTHEYTITVPDYNSVVGIWLSAPAGTALWEEHTVISAGADNGTHRKATLKNDYGAFLGDLVSGIVLPGGRSNSFTVYAGTTSGGVEQYQEYRINVSRTLSIASISFNQMGRALPLLTPAGVTTSFNRSVFDYKIYVAENVDTITFVKQNFAETFESGQVSGSYTVEMTINGGERTDITNMQEIHADITRSAAADVIEIIVSHADGTIPERVYTVTIEKTPAITARFIYNPSDATLMLMELNTGSRVWPSADGRFNIVNGYTYNYTLTKFGYIGVSGTFTVADNQSVEQILTLAPAPASTLTHLSAEWPVFRGDFTNNAVKDAPIPISSDNTVLYWAAQIGEGYSGMAAGSPIIAGGYIYTYSGTNLYKVDRYTGEIVKTGVMTRSSNFAITPPTYAEGMIFVGLSDGTVQAFNAETLDSLWIYRDAIGGQPNCTITYSDGYVYTGFWRSETENANFACLSITDENPNDSQEEKLPTWTYTQKGGFYWAGATSGDGYLLVGTDDGYSEYNHDTAELLSLDPQTGSLIDRLTGLHGDVRSNIVYDESTGAYYFTSKGGYFYGVRMNANGTFDRSSYWELKLQNGSGGTAMSTSTPVVHNGRAYIGVSGFGQFTEYDGHSITVINLPTRAIAYSVRTQGYPQTSGLLTTHYESSTGYVYVYFFDNFTPGKLRFIKDRAGQLAPLADNLVMESAANIPCAQVLFTPSAAHEQYALCSPIVDSDGTIYFKNDTGYMFALGSTTSRLEVVSQPTKQEYKAGEIFEPAGTKITAVFTNGVRRDVSQYITYPATALKAGETVRAEYKLALYRNFGGGVGVPYPVPNVTLNVSVTDAALLGDINFDGRLNMRDALMLDNYIVGALVLTPEQLAVADLDGNGRINARDMLLLDNILVG